MAEPIPEVSTREEASGGAGGTVNQVAVNLELQSTLRPSGTVELALVDIAMPEPGADEIVVAVTATPMNPSDVALLVAAADSGTAARDEREGRSMTVLQVPERLAQALKARWDRAMPVGNEGAGRVVAAGSSPEAQALLGRTVSIWGGGLYVQYRKVRAADCLVLPDGVSAAEGASAFINPLTALGMVETMRDEGHTALVHTAAASNLGQMLVRLCQADNIGLVNIVRSADQVALLKSIGAAHICDSSAPSFAEDLKNALRATGATMAFDAIGGGPIAAQILSAMEQVAAEASANYSLYGTDTLKQLYVYGVLDPRPVELTRTFGTAWVVGGWLLFRFLNRIGPARAARLKARVAGDLQGIFASRYSKVISLADACDPETLRAVTRRSTGAKYLIDPSRPS